MDVTWTTTEERLSAVRHATGGRGPDIVIEASGNPSAVSEGCDHVRDAGRYVIVGQYTDNGSIELNPHLQINRKHLEIRGCWGSDYAHLWRAMDIMESQAKRGGLDWSDLISHRYTLDQAGEALADVAAGITVKAVILPNG
jgi:L-iditol 2-dehydrogenase